MGIFIMNERALLTIVAALRCYQECPYDNDWPESEKAEFTFSQWALNEILEMVWDHPFVLASDTVERFLLKLQLYSIASVTDEQKRIFNIAEKTASKILEQIKEVEK